ncbi:MAG: porin family protein [Chitinophagaceae bacterium]
MKTIALIMTMSVSVLFAQAQKKHDHAGTQPHAEFGLKGGLNIANVHIQNASSPDAKPSFYLGGLAHIHITKHFAIQPEVMYSGQGYNQKIGNADYKINLHYINVPVLAQFMIGDGFRLQTGPQLGVLAAARQKLGGNSSNIKDAYKPVDVAWVFGAGYVTPSGFGVDARYNLGISNINDVTGTNVNNRVFQVGVFYQFKQ